jgi:hypothetical protein
MRITVEFNKILVYVTERVGFDFSGYFYSPLKKPVWACFSLHVLYRQYNSWQGRAVWEDRHTAANFRSAMELLYLINSALEMPAKKE